MPLVFYTAEEAEENEVQAFESFSTCASAINESTWIPQGSRNAQGIAVIIAKMEEETFLED